MMLPKKLMLPVLIVGGVLVFIVVVLPLMKLGSFFKTEVETSTSTGVTVDEIRELSELVPVEMKMTAKTTKTKTHKGWLFDTNSMLEVRGQGTVHGSVNLEQADIKVKDAQKLVQIRFKEVAIKVSEVEFISGSPMLETKSEGWKAEFNDKDRNDAIESLRKQFREKAIEAGIIDQTKTGAQTTLEKFIETFGYTVKVEFTG